MKNIFFLIVLMKVFPRFSSPIDFDEIFSLELKGEEYLFQLLQNIYSHYSPFSDEEKNEKLILLKKGFEFGKKIHKTQKRESGASYFTHPLLVALLLTPYKPCAKLLIATMLHDTIEDSGKDNTANEIEKIFGKEILHLVQGVSKVSSLDISKEISSLQTIQKLFSFAKNDSRTLLIKIFDRLHNIITLKGKKSFEKRKKKVKETMNVFIPTIERLGLWKVKKNIENAAMKSLYPEKYNALKKIKKRTEALQKTSIEKIEKVLENNKKFSKITIERKFYSASSLIRHHNNEKSPDESFFFIRCIVDSEKECYELSSFFASEFSKKKKESRDYISSPKENGYKALQSTFIINNAHAIRIHIVSHEMQKRNDNGIFIETHQKNFSLPFLQTESHDFQETRSESEKFLSFLTGDILVKKIKIHNKEKKSLSIPFNSTLLGAGIYFFPEKFEYISEYFINGKKSPLYSKLQENDIVEFSFSSEKQCKYEWRDYVKTPFATEKIINCLSATDEKNKKEWGYKLLQKIFDRNKCGIVNISNWKIRNLISYFSCKNIDDLYISLAEGKICKHKIYDYIYEESHKKFPFWKRNISKIFPWFFSEKKSEKTTFSFSSHLSSISKVAELLTKYMKRYDITLISSKYTTKKNTISASIHIESLDIDHQKNFISDLYSDPRIIELSFFPPISFILKMITFFFLPIAISLSIFALLITDSQNISPIFLYLSAFFIAFSNAVGYSYIAQYFSALRNNFILLFFVMFFNICITGLYVLGFITRGLDIYNLDFYFPLLVIIFSMAFPIFFFKQKKQINIEEKTITEAEFKEKQKQKVIGYLLRFGAVIIWGLEPILFKYTEFHNASPELRTFLYSLGVSISSLFCVLIYSIFLKKHKYSFSLNKYLIFIIIGSLLMTYFMNLSIDLTASTSYMILNNFAPIFALIFAFLFWRLEIPYLRKRKNAIIVFFIFLIGSIGSSFIFYNDFIEEGGGSTKGNIFALIAMSMDMLVVISQIKYAKHIIPLQGALLTFFIFSTISLLMLPFIYFQLIYIEINILYWGLIIGAISGVAFVMNYEIFRRIDGFIAYLMLNFSIIVTFLIEAFLLGEIQITYYLVGGGVLIIAASIFAEKINTKCEREQIEETQ